MHPKRKLIQVDPGVLIRMVGPEHQGIKTLRADGSLGQDQTIALLNHRAALILVFFAKRHSGLLVFIVIRGFTVIC